MTSNERPEETTVTDKKNSPAATLLAYIIIVGTLLPIYFGTVLYVTWQLWEWFLVPAGLPSLHATQMFAACCILWVITARPDLKRDADISSEEAAKRVLSFLLRPWILLLVGWILKGLF